MKAKKCQEHSLIDAHFRGKVAAAQEQAMREHLLHCDDCQAYYKRKLLLAKLDPKGLDSQTRLARGLGVDNRSYLLKPLALIAVASAVLVFMVIWYQNTVTTGNDSFVARGDNGAVEETRLWIYRVPPGKPAVAAENEIDVTDELAFAYENAENRKYLMVFGIDEYKNVYWYHPEWKASIEDPQAVAASKKLGIQELQAAIRHQLKGDTLRVFGVFTDEELTVKQVEAIIRESEGLQNKIPLKDAIQVIHELKVRH